MAKKGKRSSEVKKTSRGIAEFSPPQWNQPRWWNVPFIPDLMAPLSTRTPRVDMSDLGEVIRIEVELPGVASNSLRLSAVENVLTIQAVAESRDSFEREHYYREIYHGEFQRTLLLPCGVDWEQTKARMRSGILTMDCPKLERQEGAVSSRTIKVE